jgi:hypothetical protein
LSPPGSPRQTVPSGATAIATFWRGLPRARRENVPSPWWWSSSGQSRCPRSHPRLYPQGPWFAEVPRRTGFWPGPPLLPEIGEESRFAPTCSIPSTAGRSGWCQVAPFSRGAGRAAAATVLARRKDAAQLHKARSAQGRCSQCLCFYFRSEAQPRTPRPSGAGGRLDEPQAGGVHGLAAK